MYSLATWELCGTWPGDPNKTTPWPTQVELDYVRNFAPSAGAKHAGAPPGYALAWRDEIDKPSIGVGAGKNFAPYFVDWNVRHLAGNDDEAIEVADGEPLASTGLFGSGPFFHHRTKPQTGAPTPAPSPTGKIGTLAVLASGEPDGGRANNGPYPLFDLLVHGKLVKSAIAVTADEDEGEWQTIRVDAGLDLVTAQTVAIRFTKDRANWKPGAGVRDGEDRDLWIDEITIAGKLGTATAGKARAARGRVLDLASLFDDGARVTSDGLDPPAAGRDSASGAGLSPPPFLLDLDRLLG